MGGKELRAILAKNVKLYRSRRNWSQADLAEDANISITFLSDIERGKKWPHPDTLSNIASALDINVFELFKDNADVDPKKRVLMNRFVKDVSLSLEKSLAQSVNQSIDYLRKQYGLEKD